MDKSLSYALNLNFTLYLTDKTQNPRNKGTQFYFFWDVNKSMTSSEGNKNTVKAL